MSYGRYLRELLAPLRLYDLEAPFNGGELNVQRPALVVGQMDDHPAGCWTSSTSRPRWSRWSTARPSMWRRSAPPR